MIEPIHDPHETALANAISQAILDHCDLFVPLGVRYKAAEAAIEVLRTDRLVVEKQAAAVESMPEALMWECSDG